MTGRVTGRVASATMLVLALVAAPAVAAGCGGDDGDASGRTTAEVPGADGDPATAATDAEAPTTASTEPSDTADPGDAAGAEATAPAAPGGGSGFCDLAILANSSAVMSNTADRLAANEALAGAVPDDLAEDVAGDFDVLLEALRAEIAAESLDGAEARRASAWLDENLRDALAASARIDAAVERECGPEAVDPQP